MESEAARQSSPVGKPAASEGPTSWGPVGEGERIVALDVLRGVAVFGILLANVLIFAFPAGPGVSVGRGGAADQLVAAFQGLFVAGKFYTLFAILFGAGMALQNDRAARRGKHFSRAYLRRLATLLLIGVAHGVFLFAADILSFYALVGFVAVPFRNLRPKALLVTAVALYATGLLMLGTYAYRNDGALGPQGPDWQALAAGHRSGTQPRSAFFMPLLESALPSSEAELYEFMADEERIFREGTWREMASHRAVTSLLVFLPLKLAFLGCQTLALMLFGVYCARRFLVPDAVHAGGEYRRRAIGLLTAGLSLQLVGGAAPFVAGPSPAGIVVALIGTFAGILAMSFAYANGVLFLCAARARSAAVGGLAAAGRMALTNYLGQSVLCGLTFYSHGLGLFGRLGPLQAMALTVPVFALQMALSSLWLRHFRFGPAEWVWRSASYMRRQPMRRVHSALA